MNKEPITLHLETFNNEEYILADECIEAIGLHRRTNTELHQTIEEKDKEIERLNNIINELEEWLFVQIVINSEDDMIDTLYSWVLDKIKELKGSDKE